MLNTTSIRHITMTDCHLLRSEPQIFSLTVQVSRYFVHNKHLYAFSTKGLFETDKKWTVVSKGSDAAVAT
jgi:hypothetical protein